MRTTLAFVVALVAANPTVGWSQPVGAAAPVELAAARHVLRPYGGRAVLLDSAFAVAGTAPGSRAAQLRDSAQSRRLAEGLGARLATRPDTGAAYLILSPVEVHSDTAAVTVTVVVPSGPAESRRSFYRTVQLYLTRGAAGWRVEREVELGIS